VRKKVQGSFKSRGRPALSAHQWSHSVKSKNGEGTAERGRGTSFADTTSTHRRATSGGLTNDRKEGGVSPTKSTAEKVGRP